MSIIIEKLTLKHLDDILKINKETSASSWNRSDFESDLSNGLSISLGIIGEEIGELKCFLFARPIMINENTSQIDLLLIATSRQNQGNGLARLLLRYLLITQQSASELVLEVREKNQNALTFYQNFGLKIIHQRQNYYHDPLDNALVMQITYFR